MFTVPNIYEAVQGLLTNCRVFWLWFVFSCLSDHIYEAQNRKAKRFLSANSSGFLEALRNFVQVVDYPWGR